MVDFFSPKNLREHARLLGSLEYSFKKQLLRWQLPCACSHLGYGIGRLDLNSKHIFILITQ